MHEAQSDRPSSRAGGSAVRRNARHAGSVLLFEAHPNLSGIPDILANLSPSERRAVFDAGHQIAFDRGDWLFRQGEPHQGIFVLCDGIVRSFYVSPQGREITLAYWKPGNFVGGPEIFGSGVHVWSGVATEPGEALRLPGANVQRLISAIPNFAIGLIHGLAFKGKCYSSLLQMLGTRSVLERLAQLLCNIADARGTEMAGSIAIRDPPTHEELAAMVGATRQWVSITIERFRSQGLIAAGRRPLVVLRPASLHALASGNATL